MGRHLAQRIITAVLALEGDPRDLQRHHPLRQLGIDAPLEIDELAIGALQDAVAQIGRVHAEQAGQRPPALALEHQLLGIGPHGIHRRADRERFAAAVGDHAAMRR